MINQPSCLVVPLKKPDPCHTQLNFTKHLQQILKVRSKTTMARKVYYFQRSKICSTSLFLSLSEFLLVFLPPSIRRVSFEGNIRLSLFLHFVHLSQSFPSPLLNFNINVVDSYPLGNLCIFNSLIPSNFKGYSKTAPLNSSSFLWFSPTIFKKFPNFFFFNKVCIFDPVEKLFSLTGQMTWTSGT